MYRWQAITWTENDSIHWPIYASLDLNEPMLTCNTICMLKSTKNSRQLALRFQQISTNLLRNGFRFAIIYDWSWNLTIVIIKLKLFRIFSRVVRSFDSHVRKQKNINVFARQFVSKIIHCISFRHWRVLYFLLFASGTHFSVASVWTEGPGVI